MAVPSSLTGGAHPLSQNRPSSEHSYCFNCKGTCRNICLWGKSFSDCLSPTITMQSLTWWGTGGNYTENLTFRLGIWLSIQQIELNMIPQSCTKSPSVGIPHNWGVKRRLGVFKWERQVVWITGGPQEYSQEFWQKSAFIWIKILQVQSKGIFWKQWCLQSSDFHTVEKVPTLTILLLKPSRIKLSHAKKTPALYLWWINKTSQKRNLRRLSNLLLNAKNTHSSTLHPHKDLIHDTGMLSRYHRSLS